MKKKYTEPYRPEKYEEQIYKSWEDSGFFNPDNLPDLKNGQKRKEKFSTIMPPPNATGRLHAGHGTDMTLKDILTRYHRMTGKKTLFLPGSDHAGFEAQETYERKISKEGKSRFKMEREEFYNGIYDFVMENKKNSENDIKKLGTSCDWSRNTFTLDPQIVSKVCDTFIKMYADDLVYRGKRCIHWNPKFQTSLSDIETKFEDRKDKFYYFKYGPFVIGTARPETKFSDKYIVVHPDDERYKKYSHMQEFEVEWINGPIKATLLKDEVADMEMGSGAMTITPWHSQVDFELAQKYNLEIEQIIDWNGKLLPVAEEFAGMKILEAREKIVEKLEKKGLLEKIDENYQHNVRLCERTNVVVEPQIKDQWFVKMEDFAKKNLKALDEKKVRILTPEQEKQFRHWMENPIDWNISRQIVWGIQIPAWFNGSEIKIQKENPGDGWVQDSDTFDTWFSSGQWPLLTLGFPDGSDMEYYPTTLMETGKDLVFKWVPRMLMFGLYLDGRVPFKDIYFHGMVLDKNGKKMSKSKGNVLSPVDLAEEFGTDATRMSFVVANPPGSDMPLSREKVLAYKKFANKLWNIARFIYSNTENFDYQNFDENSLEDYQKEKISELENFKKEYQKEIEDYKIYLVAEKVYHYIWHEVADKIIEEVKDSVFSDEKNKNNQFLLLKILEESLKMLHPFMPFITEEVWKDFPKENKNLLMVEEF